MVHGLMTPPDMRYVGGFERRVGTDGLVEFVCSVAKVEGKKMTFLNIGVEDTRDMAMKWIGDTIQMKRDLNREDVQAPDKYDRMGVVVNHVQV